MIVECKECSKQVNRSPSSIVGNVFCSSSCAAKYNNRIYRKRKKEGACIICKTVIHSRNKYCRECYVNTSIGVSKYETLGDVLKDHLEKYGRRTANCFNGIRGMARSVAFKDRERKCQNCSYDKFVQVCHIKSISDFSIETPLATINAPENLAILCPNCHKELDHGMLKLE